MLLAENPLEGVAFESKTQRIDASRDYFAGADFGVLPDGADGQCCYDRGVQEKGGWAAIRGQESQFRWSNRERRRSAFFVFRRREKGDANKSEKEED